MNKAIVYIEEMDSVADVTFPAVPQVVSLLMYDDTAKTKDKPHPPNGYPVVCVTVSVKLLLFLRATRTPPDFFNFSVAICLFVSRRLATRSTTTLTKPVPSALRRTSTTLSLSIAGWSAPPPGQME